MQLLMKIFCENKGSNPDSWIEKIVLIKLRLILVHSSCHVLFYSCIQAKLVKLSDKLYNLLDLERCLPVGKGVKTIKSK